MSEPIRVLCVFSKLDRGGAENMCMNLYRRIDRNKVQFDFVKHGPEIGMFEEEICALGGRIYEAPRYKLYNHIAYCRWWKHHLENHPEHQIVHGHYFSISAVYFKVAHQLGRITVGHSHSTTVSRPSRCQTQVKRLLCKYVEQNSDYCLACSSAAGEWLFPHKKFVVLNNAVDTERFQFDSQEAENIRKELGIAQDTIIVGTVGRIIQVKNPGGIIEIYRALRTREHQVGLLWVGDGPLRGETENALAQAGILDQVIFTGVRADVDRLMQAMDVFILPSLFEGLPVVLVEAQAAGLPCLCSERVTREADVTGRCEFLPLDQPELWAKRILEVPRDRPDTRDALRQAGYDIGTTAKWLEQFYIDCLNR